MKKLLALLLSGILLLSCVGFAAAEDNKTLTVVTWDATTTPYLIAQKEAYEASHPGVTIEYVDVASQDYPIKTTTMLSGGDKSDVFMVKELDDIIADGEEIEVKCFFCNSAYKFGTDELQEILQQRNTQEAE